MARLDRISSIILLSIFAIATPALVLSVPDSSAQAARDADFPGGLRIDKARFPGYIKWSAAMRRDQARVRSTEGECARQPATPCRLEDWAQFLDTLRQADPERQTASINEFINATGFVEDRDNWGKKDYWSAPAEFFANGGDCEDYVISKYLSLRRLGFRTDDLRLVVLIDQNRRLAHAVLVVELNGRSLVLDNLDDQVRSWSELPHYRPLYSLNEQAVWLHVRVRETAQLAQARK